MADLGKENLKWRGDDFIANGPAKSVFYLDKQIVDEILEVYKNGFLLELEDYCYVPNKNWISLKVDTEPGDIISVNYYYCYDGDIVISNWDSGKGNFIFYNTNVPSGISETDPVTCRLLEIYPNPFIDHTTIRYQITCPSSGRSDINVEIGIYDLNGRIMDIIVSESLNTGDYLVTWNAEEYLPGIYIIRAIAEGFTYQVKVVKLN